MFGQRYFGSRFFAPHYFGNGATIVAAVPGHHTVSDRALYDHNPADAALFMHTVSDQESSL